VIVNDELGECLLTGFYACGELLACPCFPDSAGTLVVGMQKVCPLARFDGLHQIRPILHGYIFGDAIVAVELRESLRRWLERLLGRKRELLGLLLLWPDLACHVHRPGLGRSRAGLCRDGRGRAGFWLAGVELVNDGLRFGVALRPFLACWRFKELSQGFTCGLVEYAGGFAAVPFWEHACGSSVDSGFNL